MIALGTAQLNVKLSRPADGPAIYNYSFLRHVTNRHRYPPIQLIQLGVQERSSNAASQVHVGMEMSSGERQGNGRMPRIGTVNLADLSRARKERGGFDAGCELSIGENG